jgi:hypothetical protein
MELSWLSFSCVHCKKKGTLHVIVAVAAKRRVRRDTDTVGTHTRTDGPTNDEDAGRAAGQGEGLRPPHACTHA